MTIEGIGNIKKIEGLCTIEDVSAGEVFYNVTDPNYLYIMGEYGAVISLLDGDQQDTSSFEDKVLKPLDVTLKINSSQPSEKQANNYPTTDSIIRRVDDLGRIAIPKEIRRSLHLTEGNPMTIKKDGESIVLTAIDLN